MKKVTIIVLTVIAFVLTFIFSELFSIYHFGSVPTLLTTIYLISILSTLEYIFISITYVIKKLIKKEKIKLKTIISLILFFISLLLIFLFIITLNVDYLHMYMYTSPFYFYVIERSIEFLLPATIMTIIGIILIRKK